MKLRQTTSIDFVAMTVVHPLFYESRKVHIAAGAVGIIWAVVELVFAVSIVIRDIPRTVRFFDARDFWTVYLDYNHETLLATEPFVIMLIVSSISGLILMIGAFKRLHWLHLPFLVFAVCSTFQVQRTLVTNVLNIANRKRYVGDQDRLPLALIAFFSLLIHIIFIVISFSSFLLIHRHKVAETVRHVYQTPHAVQLVHVEPSRPLSHNPTELSTQHPTFNSHR
ncbi:hypothetical protein M3Y94_00058900 [Aphelenchoides besseyi]|nr:hypothetical protein M3Y94_00058900 [Aphelenchoides besseyi]KAI6237963.1 hypothetical protein M3Y95_00320600 [Aphelenchoides besseyi]